jgi:hypothetical protein
MIAMPTATPAAPPSGLAGPCYESAHDHDRLRMLPDRQELERLRRMPFRERVRERRFVAASAGLVAIGAPPRRPS